MEEKLYDVEGFPKDFPNIGKRSAKPGYAAHPGRAGRDLLQAQDGGLDQSRGGKGPGGLPDLQETAGTGKAAGSTLHLRLQRCAGLGFVIDPRGPCVQMARDKHLLVVRILEDLRENAVGHSDCQRPIGRLQWATTACPRTKPFPPAVLVLEERLLDGRYAQ